MRVIPSAARNLGHSKCEIPRFTRDDGRVLAMTFTSNYIVCAEREIHYTEWGAGHPETVIAWHGLARTGRDMDEVAAHLSTRYRVICPDTIGRGLSQWSPLPERVTIPGCGHAPALNVPEQVQLVERFLDGEG